MSDSNKIQMSFLRETTWGTTPSSPFTEILLTGGSFAQDLSTVESDTVRSDAQGAGFKRTSADATAAFSAEWSAGAFDEFIRGGIRSDADWSTAISLSRTDVSCTAPSTLTTAGGSWTTANVDTGDWIYISGFTTAANNGWHRVATIVSTTVLALADATLVTESAGDSVVVVGQNIANGSALSSYSLQKQYLDLTAHLLLITGGRIGSFSMDVSPGAIMTSTFDFSGKNIAAATSKAGSGNVTAATGNSVMSEVDAIGTFQIDDAAVAFDVTNFSFSVDAENRPQSGLGSIAKVGMEQGKVSVTGTMEVYLDDNSWSQLANLLAFTSFNLSVNWDDGTNRYVVHFPKAYWLSEGGDIPGVNSDKMMSLDFGCEPGGAFGADLTKTIVMAKV